MPGSETPAYMLWQISAVLTICHNGKCHLLRRKSGTVPLKLNLFGTVPIYAN